MGFEFGGPDGLNVGIVGATGMVGTKMREILVDRGFPIASLRLFASARSVGVAVPFREREIVVEAADGADVSGLDVVFFSAGGAASRALAPRFAAAGAVVIDNSSAWRMDADVPLVVPEVNADALRRMSKGIVANPNCTTMAVMPVIKPLHDAAGLVRMIASTYQAASGAGVAGIEELAGQLEATCAPDLLRGLASDGQDAAFPPAQKWQVPLAHNVVPMNYVEAEGGYTDEELKLRDESRKILGLPELRVSGTCVRVPVMTGHSVSVTAEFAGPITAEAAQAILSDAPGVTVSVIPNPLEATGRDDVYVGRIRADMAFDNGLSLFLTGDNLRKGAALNAVQIAEALVALRLAA